MKNKKDFKIVLSGINIIDSTFCLALTFLKSYCMQNLGVRKNTHIVIKGFKDNVTKKLINDEIKKENPDLVAFSCYTWNVNKVLNVCKLIKQVEKGVPIVLGGPGVSFISIDVLEKNPEIEIIVRGEGEQTFLEIIRYFVFKRGSLKSIKGISFRYKNKIIKNEDRPPIKNLDSIPSPYFNRMIKLNRTDSCIIFETSRGCNFQCNYCFLGKAGKIRYYSLKRIREELKIIMNSNVNRVLFADSIVNFNHIRFKEILKVIIDNNKNDVIFDFALDAERLDKEIIELLARACRGNVTLGLPTTNPIALENINRSWNKYKFGRNVKMLREYAKKFNILIDLIYGLPGDNFETFKKSVSYAMSLQVPGIQCRSLIVFPGSTFYNNSSFFRLKFKNSFPHYAIENCTFSQGDIDKAREFSLNLTLFRKPVIFLLLLQLNYHINIPMFNLFIRLIDFLKDRGVKNLYSLSGRKLFNLICNYIDVILSTSQRKSLILPFKDFLKFLFLYYKDIEWGGSSLSESVFLNSNNNLNRFVVEKFNHNIGRLVGKNFLYEKIDFRNIRPQHSYVILDRITNEAVVKTVY